MPLNCIVSFFQPLFLNEIVVKQPEVNSDNQVFQINYEESIYTLKAVSTTERSEGNFRL